jgi:hypothetical protein
MKTILVVLFLLVANFSAVAQSESDLQKLSKKITEKLHASITLSNEQLTHVGDAVTVFLQKKEPILPLQNTNAEAYAAQFNIINGDFISKLKNIFTARQMTTYLSLKPKANNTANVLSPLFY